MDLTYLKIKDHPILKDIDLSLINPVTSKPYSIIAFVGENGCGKTTLLNEIFNYNESKHIVDKEIEYNSVTKPFDALYLRQGSLHRNAMKEVRILIDGKNMYPANSGNYQGAANAFGLRSNNAINNLNEGLSLLDKLGDKDIYDIFKDKHIGDVYCSEEVSKLIDGKNHGYNIEKYSSGQQEVLLKIKDLQTMTAVTDVVLLDEPETSLHPRWQKEIVHLIRLMLTDNQGKSPQIFLATHSEKVLESLVKKDDTLIVRLSKEGNKIKHENFKDIELILPTPTFAELDYVIFHIASYDYHNELFNYFGSLYNKDGSAAIDKIIVKKVRKYFGKFNFAKYTKEREYFHHNKCYNTQMVSTYIRDYSHHPNNIEPPSEEELVMSIELLRTLIKYMDTEGISKTEGTNNQ